VPDVFLTTGVREGMGDAPLGSTMHAQIGRWCFETATPIVAGTFAAARAAVDVALTAADIVLRGDPVAYALCRPPGHHAPRAAYGGYCYFNNAAIAAQHLVRETGGRVTVLDVDYHHGNGTQQIFYDRADVQYVSLHGDPHRAYPYFSGFAEESGTGAGHGTTLNLPLPAGLDDDGYLAALARALDAVDAFRPAAVVVSLGVDTWMNDPIADFAVSHDGFARCGAAVARLGVPMVVVQEGGYDVSAIGENVRRWLLGAAAT
jgi:acetoin utilization deacetylase AcuC-like enzyme